MVGTLLVCVMTVLAVLHMYWAFGGRWPGTDDKSFTEMVVGTSKRDAPGFVACAAVSIALLVVAMLIAAKTKMIDLPVPDVLIFLGFWGAAFVFLARGIAGFVPSVTRYAIGTPFYRLNRMYYSPLCVAIALGLFTIGL